MYCSIRSYVIKAVLIVSLLILQGCASSGWKMEDAGIQTQTFSPKKLISFTSIVTEQPDGFSIFGFMRARRFPAPNLRGHIDIDILDSKGQVLRTDVTSFHRFGRWKHAYIKYRYKTEIPQIPPNDGVIRVSFHEEKIH